jgi:DnaJ-class molecular chaperone
MAAMTRATQQQQDTGDERRQREEADTERAPATVPCGDCRGDGYLTSFLGPCVCTACKGTGRVQS